jgi:ectoine hydroxylase-related dioxygenase (phytanoyl-CoA dioxygenase family)
MYVLPDQAELLTPAWVDEARRFLEREVASRKPGPFSLSERFTDTPPHLGLDGGPVAWNVRFDGVTVDVAPTFDDGADVTVEGDYQAAVSAAQWVGTSAPETAAVMRREIAHSYGRDALRIRGALADPAAGRLLAALHDHLARRTVDNPDLRHRAGRQGVARHIVEMEEQGYTVLERAISDAFADEVREATARTLSEHGVEGLQWMLYHGRPFELLAQHPTLLTLIDASLGRGAVIGSLSAIRRGPGPGTIPLHVDYSHVPEPFPEWAITGVGVWALEDWTEASGPTWIIPGSHRLRRAPRKGDDVSGGVPIEMPKGSVVFFTEAVWHWQGDRTEPGERITLHWHFNRGIVRSLEPKAHDPHLLHRNSPRLAEMLGRHDWFDEIHGIGRDYGRFAHMQRLLSFTSDQKAAILREAAET